MFSKSFIVTVTGEDENEVKSAHEQIWDATGNEAYETDQALGTSTFISPDPSNP